MTAGFAFPNSVKVDHFNLVFGLMVQAFQLDLAMQLVSSLMIQL
jgi:hypothetical protein